VGGAQSSWLKQCDLWAFGDGMIIYYLDLGTTMWKTMVNRMVIMTCRCSQEGL